MVRIVRRPRRGRPIASNAGGAHRRPDRCPRLKFHIGHQREAPLGDDLLVARDRGLGRTRFPFDSVGYPLGGFACHSLMKLRSSPLCTARGPRRPARTEFALRPAQQRRSVGRCRQLSAATRFSLVEFTTAPAYYGTAFSGRRRGSRHKPPKYLEIRAGLQSENYRAKAFAAPHPGKRPNEKELQVSLQLPATGVRQSF